MTEQMGLFLLCASFNQCSMAVVCYPVCGMVHIKETLLLIGKSSLCGIYKMEGRKQNGFQALRLGHA